MHKLVSGTDFNSIGSRTRGFFLQPHLREPRGNWLALHLGLKKFCEDETICKQVKVLVAQLCLTLGDPMYCSPPGSSVHGIL